MDGPSPSGIRPMDDGFVTPGPANGSYVEIDVGESLAEELNAILDDDDEFVEDMDWEVEKPVRPPQVSVLLVTHNGAGAVGYTLRSILTQSFADFEVLVVDDHSTDATRNIVGRVDDKRVRLISTPSHLGPVGARNFGFAQCQGHYVAIVEQNDTWLPFRLARQVAYLDLHKDTALVATATEYLVDGKRVASGGPAISNPGFLRWALLVGNPLVFSSVMVRKSAVESLGMFHREQCRFAEDYDLYHRLVGVARVARIDEVLTLHRGAPQPANRTMSEAEIASAARVLQDAYTPILGAGAARSAQVIMRHVGAGEPVPDLMTLRLIEAVLQAMTQYVRNKFAVDEVARGLIAAERPALMQRLVRNALRSGTISAQTLKREGLLDMAELPRGALLRDSVLGSLRSVTNIGRSPQQPPPPHGPAAMVRG
jgi:hypothetical protein